MSIMRTWGIPLAAVVGGVIGVVALWTFRASGGVCVDGVMVETGESYGFCADYDSATGALPATIAIGVLLVAIATIVRAGLSTTHRLLVPILAVLVLVAVVAGLVINLTVIDYPEGYPA